MAVCTDGIIEGNWENRVFRALDIIYAGIQHYAENNNLFFSTSVNMMYEKARSFYVNVTFCSKESGKFYGLRHSDNKRNIAVHFDCHSDCSHIVPGKKLIISLGMNDQGKEIIKTILSFFPQGGYFCPNDCLDEFEKVEIGSM